jgi:acyl-homoserine-lactone acylase
VLRRVAVLAGLTASLAATSVAMADPDAVIRRTAHGIPHILAGDWEGLGYGYGYAFAEDNICTIADSYMTVNGERSKYLGPDGTYKFQGNGAIVHNLASDFFFQQIKDAKTIEKLVAQPQPHGPKPEIREIVKGYAQGYNRYLRETGVDNLPDKTCRGKPWVRPIDDMDAYRRFYQLALLASAGVAIDGIGGAQPPTPALMSSPPSSAMYEELGSRFPLDIGSNAVALGKEATQNGRGMLLGNPHFPWYGSERFYQSQLTIPGKIDVTGGSLFGVPLVLIGHTRNMAWSHTVSTAFRFTPFELKLVPGSPTTYLYDGKPEQMTARTVTVEVKDQGKATRTLWSSRHGPILTSILGLPVFPWTPERAYALGDVNAGNFRYLNHFFDTDRAQSVDALYDALRTYQGIPWVNTLAADASGKTLYADIGAVPNVTDELRSKCMAHPVGDAIFAAVPGLPVLDGSTPDCEWGKDADAVQPGIFGLKKLPHIFRTDYVENSNDSYWLSNPHQRIEGYDRIIGNERAERALRTRVGLTMIEQYRPFTLNELQDTVMGNRQFAGELVRDDLVAMCKEMPNTAAACPVLEKWDLRDNLESRGALLFRAFWRKARGAQGGVWKVPFNVDDPVGTPRGLKSENPQVKQALVDAISEMDGAGIPLDAPLGDWQYVTRGGERIPIHGGPGTLGVFNAINVVWSGKGYTDVPHGSSFVQAVSFDGPRCPDTRTILTYSQSHNPDSPYYKDQTLMYSGKQWNRMAFCDADIDKDPQLRVTRLGNGSGVAGVRKGSLIASLRVVKRKPLTIAIRLRSAGRVALRVERGRKLVKRVAARRVRAGKTLRLRAEPRRAARGRYRVRVFIRAGKRRESATLVVKR